MTDTERPTATAQKMFAELQAQTWDWQREELVSRWAEEKDALRTRAVMAEQHKVLDRLGKSSYQEVIEDELRTKVAELELELEALRDGRVTVGTDDAVEAAVRVLGDHDMLEEADELVRRAPVSTRAIERMRDHVHAQRPEPHAARPSGDFDELLRQLLHVSGAQGEALIFEYSKRRAGRSPGKGEA